ncbi:MAG: dihydrodipicolinate reductase [archaeon]|nr:dihydrodipicolinate reductase [archaeon]
MKIMVNGLPGKMAGEVAKQVLRTEGLELWDYSLTGSEITQKTAEIGGNKIHLYTPHQRVFFAADSCFPKGGIVVDFTHPSAVNSNADFYCIHNLPFVMGTTGGDRTALEQRVRDSDVVAVIAPNMAKQIVAFQAMMKYAADTFPAAFKDYSLEIVESHQKGKADTSGTAKVMVDYFNSLGIPFDVKQIKMIRESQQQIAMEVPEESLTGHGWHTYTLKSKDGSVLFRFTHNVNGREVYAAGTIDAIRFLSGKIAAGEKGKVYSMMDVLKGK